MLDTISSPGWRALLEEEQNQPYFKNLQLFLEEERKHHAVFPPSADVFKALEMTPFEEVKMVIVGQDPYHGVGQAHGLAFSVRPGNFLPPSLRNMLKELTRDVPEVRSINQGDLSPWARQGVLLLNTTLTVRADKAGSHQGKGWEMLTDRLLGELAQQKEGLAVLLWGKHAQLKASLFDAAKHLILLAAHPSPLSAYRGFMGCGHFSAANTYLLQQGKKPIDWQV
jgi:uracil-DNA glycosylase